MIKITITSDAPAPLIAAVAKKIQDGLEAQKHVCALCGELQVVVGRLSDDDYKQARGQDILVTWKGKELGT